jgi:hypothetical protein
MYNQVNQTFSVYGLFIEAICILHKWDINKYYEFLLDLKLKDTNDSNLVAKAVCNWEHVIYLVDKSTTEDVEDMTFKQVGEALEIFLNKYPVFYKITPEAGGHLVQIQDKYCETFEEKVAQLTYYYGYSPLLETFSPKGSDFEGHYKYELINVHTDKADSIEYREIVFKKFYSNDELLLEEFVKTGKTPFDRPPSGYLSKCDKMGVRLQCLKTKTYQSVEVKFCTEQEWRRMSCCFI